MDHANIKAMLNQNKARKLPNSGSSHDSAPGQYMGDYSQKTPAKLTSLE